MHAQNRGGRAEKRAEESGHGDGEGSQDPGKCKADETRRQDEADRLKAEAEALKDKTRLEDLHIWQMKKVKRTTKKDTRTYAYWMASWREGHEVRNVHLGSTKNIDAATARERARKIKAESLGLTGASPGAEPG